MHKAVLIFVMMMTWMFVGCETVDKSKQDAGVIGFTMKAIREALD